MKILKVQLRYIYKVSDETPEAFEERKATRVLFLRSLGIACDDLDSYSPTVLMTSDQLALVMLDKEEGQQLSVLSQITISAPFAQIEDSFHRQMMDPLAEHPDPRHNNRCEIHMPGQALLTYNETMLLENSCQDQVQIALDAGWRVIAACPQPDGRRPDWILGRFNPERNYREHGEAKRRV